MMIYLLNRYFFECLPCPRLCSKTWGKSSKKKVNKNHKNHCSLGLYILSWGVSWWVSLETDSETEVCIQSSTGLRAQEQNLEVRKTGLGGGRNWKARQWPQQTVDSTRCLALNGHPLRHGSCSFEPFSWTSP